VQKRRAQPAQNDASFWRSDDKAAMTVEQPARQSAAASSSNVRERYSPRSTYGVLRFAGPPV
jgi:hypothetical protein